MEIYPVYANGYAIRVEFFGDEIDRISQINPVTGQAQRVLQHVAIYPASHYVTTKDKMERRRSKRSWRSGKSGLRIMASSSRPSALTSAPGMTWR